MREQSLYPLEPTRRVFVKGLGFVSAGLVLSTLGGCEALAEQIANRPVRRRLREGSSEIDDVLAVYADAVEAMRDLPTSNPRSWAAQYQIHGNATSFNHCQHGTDHFFTWHRAYLAYFEKICQEVTGDATFALPYWNWNQDPTMHSGFTAAGSNLNHGRNSTSVSGSAFSDSTFDTILGDSNFFTFSSQVEGSPHNTAHVFVGQDMVTGASPNDPVFWAHHCMVDYVWYKWNVELENDNPSDAAWNEESWDHFVDGAGDPVEITAGATVLLPLLWYRYESSALGGSPAVAESMVLADSKRIERRLEQGAPVSFDVRRRIRVANDLELVPSRTFSVAARTTPADFAALLENRPTEEQIFASLEYAERPASNDFLVRVFVNRPDAGRGTPTSDPHFAGTFAFFGTSRGHADAGHGDHAQPRFLVNLTDTLRRLRSLGRLRTGDELTFQLVAVPVGPTDRIETPSLRLSRAELLVTPVLVRGR